MRRIVALLVLSSILPACSRSGGSTALVIHDLTAEPAVVPPGGNSVLSVSASDERGGPLTYSWEADQGSLSSATGATTFWTAPHALGVCSIRVTVRSARQSVEALFSILVSAGPSGPVVTSVLPGTVDVGQEIRILGVGFGAAQGSSSVDVGGAPMLAIAEWSDTEIRGTVPDAATTGMVTVRVAGSVSSAAPLVVLWNRLNPGNVAACIAANFQEHVRIAPDGEGGIILVWDDDRVDPKGDIYAQRIDAQGIVRWAANGVAVCALPDYQVWPEIVSDGAGGAIIVWSDNRNGFTDLYAQRLDAWGTPLWAGNGVPVTTAPDTQAAGVLVSDGARGVIVAWQDYRNGNPGDVYAQRISEAGAPLWTTDGVPVVTLPFSLQGEPEIASDGAGGALITWLETRNHTFDIYAQRVSASGALQWALNGVPVCAAPLDQGRFRTESDGFGGLLVAWQDERNPTSDIYAQRLNGSGTPLWAVDGIPVCAAARDQFQPRVVGDGTGGAIVAWLHSGAGTGQDVYAQRVYPDGTASWAPDGVPLCTTPGSQLDMEMAADPTGGAVLTWSETRFISEDVYAQKVDLTGAIAWAVDGLQISTGTFREGWPRAVCDRDGNVIVAWFEKLGVDHGVHAQRVTAAGR